MVCLPFPVLQPKASAGGELSHYESSIFDFGVQKIWIGIPESPLDRQCEFGQLRPLCPL